MRSRFILLVIFGLFMLISCNKSDEKQIVANVIDLETPKNSQISQVQNLENKEVLDEQAAINIALKAWIPAFGKKQIEDEKPYQATLKNGVWTVLGSLPKGWNVGGVAMAKVSQKDGRILAIGHGK